MSAENPQYSPRLMQNSCRNRAVLLQNRVIFARIMHVFCTCFCIEIEDRNADRNRKTIPVPIPEPIAIFARSSARVLTRIDNEDERIKRYDYGTKA